MAELSKEVLAGLEKCLRVLDHGLVNGPIVTRQAEEQILLYAPELLATARREAGLREENRRLRIMQENARADALREAAACLTPIRADWTESADYCQGVGDSIKRIQALSAQEGEVPKKGAGDA